MGIELNPLAAAIQAMKKAGYTPDEIKAQLESLGFSPKKVQKIRITGDESDPRARLPVTTLEGLTHEQRMAANGKVSDLQRAAADDLASQVLQREKQRRQQNQKPRLTLRQILTGSADASKK